VGRAGLSQLHHLDLTDLASDTDEAFVETAVALAGNLARLSALRSQLRARMENSPLMDAARFTRHIEQAYRSMWDAYRISH
jgi:predicted O-linked N-acetylglucosamine transferase (SPINDLY family)